MTINNIVYRLRWRSRTKTRSGDFIYHFTYHKSRESVVAIITEAMKNEVFPEFYSQGQPKKLVVGDIFYSMAK